MSRYRKIDVRIWNDAKFRDLSDNAKLVFFFLLIHPNITALGAMRATIAGLAAEFIWDFEAFAKSMPNQEQEQEQEHTQSEVSDIDSQTSKPPSGGVSKVLRFDSIDVEFSEQLLANLRKINPDFAVRDIRK